MVVCLQGNGITENGLLIKKSDVLCYKRGHNILKSTLRRRPKSKSCRIFIFEKGIVLAEKVYDAVGADRGQSFVLKHLTTFTVSKINFFCEGRIHNIENSNKIFAIYICTRHL